MARKKKRRIESDDDQEQVDEPKRRFRIGCSTICLLLLFLIVVGLFFAPTIVANTSLRNSIVPMALSGFEGDVTIESASLGWMSSVQLSNVKATDTDGQPLFEIKTISSEKTLLDLVLNQTQLGKFTISEPHIQLKITEHSSNVEDAIAGLLTSSGDTAMPQFAIVVEQGQVDALDTTTDEIWSLENVIGKVEASGIGGELIAKASMDVSTVGTMGKVEVDLRIAAPESEAGPPNVVAIKSEKADLSLAQPFLRRFVGETTTRGSLGCEAKYSWDDQGVQMIQIHELRGTQLILGAKDLFGSDRLQLPLVTASGKLSISGDQVSADQFVLTTDLANVKASGSFRLNDISPDVFSMLLQDQDFRVTGDVDLAQLAALFPETLRIREGTNVTSGKVTGTLFSRVENNQRRWAAVVETANISAVNAGRTIRWDQPVHVTMFANRSDSGPVIERMTCKSSFLQLDGQGTPASGNITARGSLDQLAAELSKFVDLQGFQLAGKLDSKLNWSASSGRLQVGGSIGVQDFALVVPGALPWREQLLTLTIDAAGQMTNGQISQLETAKFHVESGSDVLNLDVTEAASLDGKAQLPVECKLRGSLATWLPRVQSWLPLDGLTIAGGVDFAASGTASSDSFQIASSKMTLENLQIRGQGVRIIEPKVQAEAKFAANLATGAMSSKEATLVSSSVSVRTGNIKVEQRNEELALSGQVAFRGDLGRLMAWTNNSSAQRDFHLFGQAVGQASMLYQDGVTLADWTADINDFVYAQRRDVARTNLVAAANPGPWESVWREKKLSLKGKGDFAHASGDLQAEFLDVTSQALRFSAKGKIGELSKKCVIDASGELTYDLKTVAPVLRPYLGKTFTATGGGSRKFSIRGPMFHDRNFATATWLPDELGAQTSVGWTTAHLQGFDFGKGDLSAKLSEGVVHVDPIDLPVNKGRVKIAPQILLNSNPPVIVAERGRVIDKVQISPEMCHTWLKYVAPLLADATVAKGEFSMDLESAKVPLMSPTTGNVRGTLDVHGAQVGPGPLGQQIEAIARQVIALTKGGGFDPSQLGRSRDWLTLPEQKVKYHLSDGRVYHDGLTITSRDVTIVTKGYVGLDQTLSITAQIPIRDDWVASNKLLANLKGQTLEVPIRGTLSKPAVDNRIFANLTKNMLGGTVENLIEDQLKKGLEGLFGPKK